MQREPFDATVEKRLKTDTEEKKLLKKSLFFVFFANNDVV